MSAEKKSLPFDVLCLTVFSRETWVGRPVLHPKEQIEGVPHWNPLDYKDYGDDWSDPEMCADELVFDLGLVVVVEDDEQMDRSEVTFLQDDGRTLHYGADNLWVPVLSEETRQRQVELLREERGAEGGWERISEGFDTREDDPDRNLYIEAGDWVWRDEAGAVRRHYGWSSGSYLVVHTLTADGCYLYGMEARDLEEWDSGEADGGAAWLLPSLRAIVETWSIEEGEE